MARRHGPELGALGALGPLGPLGPLVMLKMVAVADIHWSWTTSKPADPGPSFMGLATAKWSARSLFLMESIESIEVRSGLTFAPWPVLFQVV